MGSGDKKDIVSSSSPSQTTEHFPYHLDVIYSEDTLDGRYLAKARILNNAVQDIGMGKYQWCVASEFPPSRSVPPIRVSTVGGYSALLDSVGLRTSRATHQPLEA